MSIELSEVAPDGWRQPPIDLLVHAKAKALEALHSEGVNPVQGRLACFYDVLGDYAGATFAQLQPADPLDITASDLLATTLLSVRIGPRSTRRLLHAGSTQGRPCSASSRRYPTANLPRRGFLS